MFLICLFCNLQYADASENIQFTTIDQRSGLPSNNIISIYKDSKGFMWFGSVHGLIRYDSRDFIVYKYNPHDSKSISNNEIKAIAEDASGNLWIGTENGLNLYNWNSDDFIKFIPDSSDNKSISNHRIRNFLLDSKGRFWITTREGLNLLTKTENGFSFRSYYPPRTDTSRTSEWSIVTIIEDQDGDIWVGTWGRGLCQFDPVSGKFISYMKEPENPFSIAGNIVEELEQLPNGLIIVGFSGENLQLFDKTTRRFHSANSLPEYRELFKIKGPYYCFETEKPDRLWIGNFKGLQVFDLNKKKIIYDNTLKPRKENQGRPRLTGKDQARVVYKDYTGIIWVGYGGLGIDKYDPNKDKFSKYFVSLKTSEISQDYISDFLYINKNEIWVTTNNGIIKTNTSGTELQRITIDKKKENTGYNTIIQDVTGHLWIGTNQGLVKLNPATGNVVKRIRNHNNEIVLTHNSIINLDHDDDGRFWILTQEGLHNYDPAEERFIENNITRKFGNTKISCVFRDRDNDYWIGTTNGLYVYDTITQNFRLFLPKKNNENSLINRMISSVIQDSGGNIWIATRGGISKYDKRKNSFENFHEKDGLPNTLINRLAEDNEGNIWFSSFGISKIDVKTKLLTNYTEDDGLAPKTHNLLTLKNGQFVTLNEKGFHIFYPDSIRSYHKTPQLYLTGLSIAGRTITPGSPILQGYSLIEAKNIRLNYSQRVINFQFSALNYTLPSKTKYKYILEGYDEKWNNPGTKNNFTLMNLSPGKYTLKVRASNSDGVWSKHDTQLNITVDPPYYLTWWAYIVYIMIFCTIFFLYRYYTIKMERVKSQLKFEKLNAQKEHELDQLKLKFFINISHEFKTPLTLILGLLSHTLKSKSEKTMRSNIQTAIRNALRLKKLINQLLDLRKLDTGKIKPEIRTGDIKKFSEKICSVFNSLAAMQEQKFEFFAEEKDMTVFFDPDKTEKIISNLLANAFKHTKKGGEISLSVTRVLVSGPHPENELIKMNSDSVLINSYVYNDIKDGLFIHMKVKDEGIGVSEENIKNIFERFHQIENSKNAKSEGTGIGLSLVNELVKILKGMLFIKSQTGKGTEISVYLPAEKQFYYKDEIIKHPIPLDYSDPEKEEDVMMLYTQPERQQELLEDDKADSSNNYPLVVVIEDNRELLDFIGNLLKENNYRVKKAVDGKEGFEKIRKFIPDLIISDIMMPRMNGIDLCNNLKKDKNLNLIPVILLTAKNSIESVKEGYEQGADDYIVKPFNNELLLTRIDNLIQSRKKLRDSLKSDIKMPFHDGELLNKDEQFLSSAYKIIQDNLTNPDFTQSEFCEHMNMSKSQLYKRLKALTNESINEFVRNIRLKKAEQIFRKVENIPISEVAYLVGFSDPNYFTRVFRQYFGESPKKYIENLNKDETD